MRTFGERLAAELPAENGGSSWFADEHSIRWVIPQGGEHWGFELIMLRNILFTFALIGLGLAAMGIYGVIARNVAQRSTEIGIRMALGANVSDVVSIVLRSGIRLALIGSGLGLLGACGLARFVAIIMPSLQANGNLVLGLSTPILALIALMACYLPARRASKIDPIIALRMD